MLLQVLRVFGVMELCPYHSVVPNMLKLTALRRTKLIFGYLKIKLKIYIDFTAETPI